MLTLFTGGPRPNRKSAEKARQSHDAGRFTFTEGDSMNQSGQTPWRCKTETDKFNTYTKMFDDLLDLASRSLSRQGYLGMLAHIRKAIDARMPLGKEGGEDV